MDEARIPPAPRPYPPEIEESLARLMGPGVEPLRLFRTLAQNPRVLSRFLAGGLLDKGSISLRERELAILRTTARCGSEYEWGVHVAFFAGKAGLTDEQVASLAHGGAADPCWTPGEALLIRLCDELHETSTVSDALWSALRAERSEEAMLELLMLAGSYRMVSYLTNALRLPREPYAARFPLSG